MTPLKISAHLKAGLSVYDDYSPDLGAILEYCWLDERDLFSPNPDPANIITPDLPIARHEFGNDWLWAISAPCYQYAVEYIDKARKRWDADLNYPINWGKRKAKIQTDGGAFKSADRPVPIRVTQYASWYAVGDADEVQSLLSRCTSIGSRRAIGNGQVWQWSVTEHHSDWSLTRDGQLMTPLPHRFQEDVEGLDLSNVTIMRWNIKAPRWDKTQAELCFLPKGLVQMVTESGVSTHPVSSVGK